MVKQDSPDEGVKPKVEEENNLDATPAAEEEASEEVSETKTESAEEVVEEEKETGDSSKKKGYSQRVRQLNEKAKKAEEKAQSLEEKLAELTTPVESQVGQTQPQAPQNEPIVKPGEEISAGELDKRIRAREDRILQRADALAEMRSKQLSAVTRINNEASEVLRIHPELDPESEVFDKELSESITEATEAYVRNNPYSASVKNFVAKQMKPFKRAVAKEAGQVTENVAKQASETALRPVSVKSGDKKFEDLTEAEMEEKLGIVY